MRRRTFLHAVGVGAATASVTVSGVSAASADTASRGRSAQEAASSQQALFGGAVAGASLGAGWRIETTEQLDLGVLRVTLAHLDGTREHVLGYRRQPGVAGVATTRLLDLRLQNGADGAVPTHEGVGSATLRLAARLRASEREALRRGLTAQERAYLRGLRTHARLYEERSVALGWGPAGAPPA